MKHEARILFIFGIIVLFIGTASESGITGKDEFWVTMRTPMEMLERDSWWTLWLNEEVRLQKPPLVYWFIATGYSLFGIEFWVARLVGVLSGAGMAAVTGLLYRRLFARSGFLAGLMVLATAGIAVEGRRAMLDVPLGFFCLLSVYLALAAHQEKSWKKCIAAGAALAAATLAKGPQSLLFVAPALILGYLVIEQKRPWKQLLIPAAMFGAAFLLLALPWPLSMRVLHADFIEELQTQIVHNRLNKVDLGSPFNALGGALLLVFPWSFVLLTALIGLFWKRCPWRNRESLWLGLWLLASVLPFFFMRAFERYMIPIIPCASILILRCLEELPSMPRRILISLSAALLSLVSLTFSAFGLWFDLSFWAALFTLSMTFWLLWSTRGERLDRPIIATIWLFCFVLGVLYPRFGVNRLPDNLPWQELARHPVGIYSKYSQPSMLSMRLGRSVIFPYEERLNENGFDGYIFTTHDQLMDPDPTDKKVAYLDHALRTAGIPWEEAGRYPVLFSRRNWIRFTRPDASWEDWKEALRTRSLVGLKSEIVYVRTGSIVQKTP